MVDKRKGQNKSGENGKVDNKGEIRGAEKCEQQGRGEEKLEKRRMW